MFHRTSYSLNSSPSLSSSLTIIYPLRWTSNLSVFNQQNIFRIECTPKQRMSDNHCFELIQISTTMQSDKKVVCWWGTRWRLVIKRKSIPFYDDSHHRRSILQRLCFFLIRSVNRCGMNTELESSTRFRRCTLCGHSLAFWGMMATQGVIEMHFLSNYKIVFSFLFRIDFLIVCSLFLHPFWMTLLMISFKCTGFFDRFPH